MALNSPRPICSWFEEEKYRLCLCLLSPTPSPHLSSFHDFPFLPPHFPSPLWIPGAWSSHKLLEVGRLLCLVQLEHPGYHLVHGRCSKSTVKWLKNELNWKKKKEKPTWPGGWGLRKKERKRGNQPQPACASHFLLRCSPFHLLELTSSAISLDLSYSGLTCSSYLGIIVWAAYKLHKFISHGFGDRKSGSGYQHGQRVALLFSFANGYLLTMSSHGRERFSLCLSLSLFLSLSLPFCLSASLSLSFSLSSLLIRALIPSWGLCSHKLRTSHSPCLLIPLPCGLGFQQMDLGDTNNVYSIFIYVYTMEAYSAIKKIEIFYLRQLGYT